MDTIQKWRRWHVPDPGFPRVKAVETVTVTTHYGLAN